MGKRVYNAFVKVLLLLVAGLQMFIGIGHLAMLPIPEAGENKMATPPTGDVTNGGMTGTATTSQHSRLHVLEWLGRACSYCDYQGLYLYHPLNMSVHVGLRLTR